MATSPNPNDVPTGPMLLTIAEVAAVLRVSKMTVYRLCEATELGHLRVGKSFRVPQDALEEYVAGARVDAVQR